MQIHGPGHVQGAPSVNAAQQTSASQNIDGGNLFGVDQLEISHEADMIRQVADLPDIRADRVADIRTAIASGVYETAEKMDVALDRLLDELEF